MATLRLPPLPTIRDIVKLYRISALKRLSQNFLLDPKLCDKIVKQAGKLEGATVVEVGPGPGGLTRAIIRRSPERLIVVEKDLRFKSTLEMLMDAFGTVGGKMDVYYNDILTTNISKLIPEGEKTSWDDTDSNNIHIIGNLPFSVSTHLIIKWLQCISQQSDVWSLGRTRMTLTFQKEVAERLVARELTEHRCRLSVMAQAWTNPKLKFVIPGSAFLPKPDVDVGVVTFSPLKTPRTNHDFQIFEKVNRHIFSFRQKYVIRGIETLFPLYCREELGAMMFKLTDINPELRSFQLKMEDIDKLVTAYLYLVEKHPEIECYEYRVSRKLLSRKYTSNIQLEPCRMEQ